MRLLAVSLAFAASAGAASVGPAPPNWTRTVTLANGSNGANGAHIVGNPKAAVRVVEYTSYTCSHCATFARDGQPKLLRQIARGTVAFEVRNAVRDRLDFAGALAARCGGPARFLGHHDAIFAAQGKLGDRTVAWQAGAGKAAPTDANAGLRALARGSGLTALMAARGVTPAALDACLTSKAAQAPVLAMTNDAWNGRKIGGTPAFLVNDEAVAAATYETLDPIIRARLGGVAQQGR